MTVLAKYKAVIFPCLLGRLKFQKYVYQVLRGRREKQIWPKVRHCLTWPRPPPPPSKVRHTFKKCLKVRQKLGTRENLKKI